MLVHLGVPKGRVRHFYPLQEHEAYNGVALHLRDYLQYYQPCCQHQIYHDKYVKLSYWVNLSSTVCQRGPNTKLFS